MSWYVYSVPVSADRNVHDAVQGAIQAAEAKNPGYAKMFEPEGVQEQIQAATEAVERLISADVLGSGPLLANLNGHWNPDHRTPQGVSGDTISVTVFSAAKPSA